MNNDLREKVDELIKAKENVKFCLENANGLIDMHGLEYWASVVEKLRTEIKELLQI